MILSCNSCEKKFVVPDQAITAIGRTVQCGSCGNKWKQFPSKDEINKFVPTKKVEIKKISKSPKTKINKNKKARQINLYSPEYLAKKHGIVLNNVQTKKDSSSNEKVYFGFYNSLIVFIFVSIVTSRVIYFLQEFIIRKLPFTEYYLNYFFESIRNIYEIWNNLIFSY
jgi:predicted Zn finger-like uncharacterized protein